MSTQRLPGFTAEAALSQATTHYHTTGTGSSTMERQANIEPQNFWDDVGAFFSAVGEVLLGAVETLPGVGSVVQYGDCTVRCIADGGSVAECAQACSPLG